MELRKMLSGRIGRRDVSAISMSVSAQTNPPLADLIGLAGDTDDRVAYNALWILTHLPASCRCSLHDFREIFIYSLMATGHVGKKRLLLNLLEGMKTDIKDFRADYLDWCLERINSSEPYAIRSFCLKQAYDQCRFYPELMPELIAEMEMMECGELSPGLRSSLRIVRKRMAKNGNYGK